jgi:hypothetical protein
MTVWPLLVSVAVGINCPLSMISYQNRKFLHYGKQWLSPSQDFSFFGRKVWLLVTRYWMLPCMIGSGFRVLGSMERG